MLLTLISEKEKMLVTSIFSFSLLVFYPYMKNSNIWAVIHSPSVTAAVAWWLECPPREREVIDLIPGRDRPKYLKNW